MAISWWNILLSMDNMNPHCFGQMELALPQSGELASIKKPLGNKGLTLRGRLDVNLRHASFARYNFRTECNWSTLTTCMNNLWLTLQHDVTRRAVTGVLASRDSEELQREADFCILEPYLCEFQSRQWEEYMVMRL